MKFGNLENTTNMNCGNLPKRFHEPGNRDPEMGGCPETCDPEACDPETRDPEPRDPKEARVREARVREARSP